MIRSPEEVRPFPQVEASSVLGRGNRNRGKTRILTDTSENEEITAKKQTKIRPPKQSAKKRKNSAARSDDDENDGAELYSSLAALNDPSSNESLHYGELGEDFEPFDAENTQVESFVLVKFELRNSKKCIVFYISQIKGESGSDVEVSFLRRNGGRFVFPDIEDKAFMS